MRFAKDWCNDKSESLDKVNEKITFSLTSVDLCVDFGVLMLIYLTFRFRGSGNL